MEYTGRVFRPPSEARSLIIQATLGCSHNKCRFCDMYKEKAFRIRTNKEILGDFAEAREITGPVRRIFLADGDALIIPYKQMAGLLDGIRRIYPEAERISCYASPKSVLNKTPEQLKDLKDRGLTLAYLGLESGDDEVLRHINKGNTAAEIVKAGQMLKEAGIKVSVTAISGIGGTKRWQEHAIATGQALSAMKPDYIGLLTFRVEGQAPMVKEVAQGKFTMLTPEQIAAETRLMLDHLDSEGTVFRANHVSNYVNLAGTLNRDIPAMKKQLDAALAGRVPFKSEYLRNIDVR
ncbi:MAG: radical SAM protein [Eubacteriaceae bacterium]|jgi:radical SAM superfamily enzyme YgiQ (UPF0313 family)